MHHADCVRRIGVLALIIVAGCGGEDDNKICEQPTGSWRIVLHERSGTCDLGEDIEIISTFNNGLEDFDPAAGCAVSSEELSDNGCQSNIVLKRCPVTDPAGRVSALYDMQGYVRIESASRLSGEFTTEYVWYDGDSCISTFEVSGRRR